MMAKQEYGPCQGTGGRIVTLEHEGVNFFGDVIVSQVRPVRLLDAHDLVGKETKWISTLVSIARLLAPFYHLVLDLSYSISNHETHVPTNGVSTEPFLTVDRK